MTPVVVSLTLYAVLGGAVAAPFIVVGVRRFRDGRSTLGRVLIAWAVLVVCVPILAISAAYAYGRREAGFSDRGEVYPLWPFVLVLTAFGSLGGTSMWFLGWVLAWGVEPESRGRSPIRQRWDALRAELKVVCYHHRERSPLTK